MEQVSPTRMNLITRKAQIKLATQGAELLRNKRDALLQEFFNLIKPLIALRKELNQKISKAEWQLFLALVFDGRQRLASAAMARWQKAELDITLKNVWGIRVAELQDKTLEPEYLSREYAAAGTSVRIDQTMASFGELLWHLLKVAPVETKLKKLGEEIKKSSRRVNALEQRLIPRLSEEKRYIQQTLEEREREDLFRLKRIKQKR
ncbi:MAG: V-type ATP synthase subunit D [Candidatus Omnitrophota bacterium]